MVSPSHVGTLMQWKERFGEARAELWSLTGEREASSWPQQLFSPPLAADIALAGDGVAFVHEPSEGDVLWEYGGFGYRIGRLGVWQHLRTVPGYTGWGDMIGGVAGGPDGSVAMLGEYLPFDTARARSRFGLIQAFSL